MFRNKLLDPAKRPFTRTCTITRLAAVATLGFITLLAVCQRFFHKSPATAQQHAGIPPPACLRAHTDAHLQGASWPSLATYERLQANPALVTRDPTIAVEFEAAPWLLPLRTAALPYAGIHNLEKLLHLRATPIGIHTKAITLLTFSKRVAAITQNCIYSMVKFGGVRNYIVGTWQQEDLEACADLNLPCTDISSFLPEPMTGGDNAGALGTHDYYVVCWLRPAIVAFLLQQGYVVFSTDSDIAYLNKPVWKSYLDFIEEGQADAAFQMEGPINGGNYVVLPTMASIVFMQAWAALARDSIKKQIHDQDGMPLIDKTLWAMCSARTECSHLRNMITQDNRSNTTAVIRTYLPRFFNYWDDRCGLAQGLRTPLIDLCDWAGASKAAAC